MSAIANLNAAPAAFPPVNLHAHGHKRGGHVQATDADAGNGTAQVPPGLRQNLFGSLLNSLQQVIGVQLGVIGSATAAPIGSTNAETPGAAADTTAAGTGAGGANAAAATPGAPAQSSIAMLQNYLNNLAHNAHTDDSPAAKSAGSSVSLSA